jgi:Heterokaryon incompatibility protein (HET)
MKHFRSSSQRLSIDPLEELQKESILVPTSRKRQRLEAWLESRSPSDGDFEESCSQCKQIDFEAIFDPAAELLPESGRPIANLSDNISELGATSCALCRLFSAVRKKIRKACHLRAYSALQVLGFRNAKAPASQGRGVLLTVTEGHINELGSAPYKLGSQRHEPVGWSTFIIPVTHLKEGRKSCVLAGNVVTGKINYELVKSWIHNCQTQHTKPCNQQRSIEDGVLIKVIDCASRQVVQLDVDKRYLALSYRWAAPQNPGQDTNSEQVSSTAAASSFHELIDDAMKFTLSLGVQFLWVDQYCIDQSSISDKHRQISQMDKIYAGALATIIAVSSRDSHEGLPGVALRPRKTQASAITARGTLLVAAIPPTRRVFQFTEWNSRGWTYQEAMLSSRCLVLTEDQVYFFCQTMSTSESMCGEVVDSAATLNPSLLGAGEIASRLGSFASHLTSYTARNLTYESDRLNAFRGILNRQPCSSFWGVSIFPMENLNHKDKCSNVNSGFAHGLLWKVMEPQSRRRCRQADFPSWSWASQLGQIFWAGPVLELQYMDMEKQSHARCIEWDTKAKFWVDNGRGVLLSLADWQSTFPNSKILPEVSRYIHVKGDVLRFRISREDDDGYCVLPLNANGNPLPMKESRGQIFVHFNCPESQICSMLKEPLDAILLLQRSTGWLNYHLVLLEWHGDIAVRLGLMEVRSLSLDKVPRIRKRFILA